MDRLAVDYRHFTGVRVQGEVDGRFFGPNFRYNTFYADFAYTDENPTGNPIRIAGHSAFFYVGLFLIR
jgi:hypothetical protein